MPKCRGGALVDPRGRCAWTHVRRVPSCGSGCAKCGVKGPEQRGPLRVGELEVATFSGADGLLGGCGPPLDGAADRGSCIAIHPLVNVRAELRRVWAALQDVSGGAWAGLPMPSGLWQSAQFCSYNTLPRSKTASPPERG